MPDPDRASRAGAATALLHRGALARSSITSWTLRVGTAAALGIDAAVHTHLAPAYDPVKATVSQGQLFRVEAGLAIVAGLLVLIRPRPSSWIAALLVSAGGLAGHYDLTVAHPGGDTRLDGPRAHRPAAAAARLARVVDDQAPPPAGLAGL